MGHLRARDGRRGKIDEAEVRAAKAQRREIERLARLNHIEQERFATMMRAKSERQEAASQRLRAKQVELIVNARVKGEQKRERSEQVRARAQSARAKKQEDAMNLAESIRSEHRVRQPPPCSMHLRAQRFRRAKGRLAEKPDRPQHRPHTAAKKRVESSPPRTPARPRTAPQAVGRPQRVRQAELPTSPGFRNFRPRDAPAMPALKPEELERLGLRAKRECGVCLRQYLLSELPGVTTRRAITRLQEKWVKELGTAEPVNVDKRASKPAQYYSEVRVCVFCFQFLSGGVNDGPENDHMSGDTPVPLHCHKDPTWEAAGRHATKNRSPATARLNGSPLPARYGRHQPRLGDHLLAATSATPTLQATAAAAAVEEAKAQSERMAEERRIIRANREPVTGSDSSQPTTSPHNAARAVDKNQAKVPDDTLTRAMGAQVGSLGRKRGWRVDAQRTDYHRSTQRSPRAKLFATPTPPRSAPFNCDLTYRRRGRQLSPSPERQSRKETTEQLDDLVSQAKAAQERDEPGVISSLLLSALKLAPGNDELARLQAKAALEAKARARVEEEERQTARWMQRLAAPEHKLDKRSTMLATASIEVDLFVSKKAKTIEIEAASLEEADRLFELIAQKKAAGEIAVDQNFRTVSATDAVIKRKKAAERKARDDAENQARLAKLTVEREEAAKTEAAEAKLAELVQVVDTDDALFE